MSKFSSNLMFALSLLKKGSLSKRRLMQLARESGNEKGFLDVFFKKAREEGLSEKAETVKVSVKENTEEEARKRLEEKGIAVPEGRNAVRFEKKINAVDEYKSFVAAALESGMEFEKAVELANMVFEKKGYKRYLEKKRVPYYLKEALRISFTPKLPSGKKKKTKRRK